MADAESRVGTGDMPEKEQVVRDLLEQMSMYPEDTTFFLNVWCFGCVLPSIHLTAGGKTLSKKSPGTFIPK